MAYQIVINKRFSKKMLIVLDYLHSEFGNTVANEFQDKMMVRLYSLQINPYIGAPTGKANIRSTLVTKRNRVYYRIIGNKIVILNLFDTRSNYKKRQDSEILL